jgi:hypothetical protein
MEISDRRGTARQLHFAPLNREVETPMTDMDYRDMANEIRALIPLLIHPQAVADLSSLADQYERLARYLEVLPGALPDTPLQYRRQAG